MNNTKIKKIICSVLIFMVASVLIIPFWYNFILSLKDFKFGLGFLRSQWCGLENYEFLFKSGDFATIFSNSLVISVMGTIFGAMYVFVSSLSIGSVKTKGLKGLLTAIFAIPAVVPVNLFVNIYPTEFFAYPSDHLQFCVSLIEGLRFAGLFTLIALFIKGNVIKESAKCMLLFVGIRLMFILSPDLTVMQNTNFSPLTYEMLDVFPTHIYRTLMTGSSIGIGTAMHTIKALLQFVPAIVGCVILIFVTKNNTKKIPESNQTLKPALISVIIPVVILFAVIITGGSLLPVIFDETVISGYIIEFLIASVSAVLVTVISFGLAVIARNSIKGIGIFVIGLVCITGDSLIGTYMLMRDLSLLNSILAIVLYNLNMIPVLTLIMTLATFDNRNIRKDLAVVMGGFVLMFSRFWGDYIGSYMMLTVTDIQPLSITLNEIRMLPEYIVAQSQHMEGIIFSTMPYILIPLSIALVGFVVSDLVKKD